VELYLHSPSLPSWCGAQLKHRDNFTLLLLTDEECQHDFAAAHIGRASMDTKREVCGDRILSSDLLAAHSPNLGPHDFYLRGNLKQEVYISISCTVEEVEVFCFPREVQCMNINSLQRCRKCTRNNREHFQYL
jgi:hypothetical protein